MLRNSINQGVRKFSASTASAVKSHRLEGKIAIVTASTDGIGFSTARRLAQEGAKVMISSRKESNVQKAVQELQSEGLEVKGVICHVGKKEDRKNLLQKTKEEFGGIDILVSNAAVNPGGFQLLDCPEEVWDKIFDINVKSAYLLMQESLPFLRESKSPSIILMSSIAGYVPFRVLGAYSVSKTTLFGLCRAAADELAPENIRVNCIAPGIIKTKFSSMLYESPEAEELARSSVPLDRLGVPDDVAGTAAFLASDDASYITGETIVVAGGMRSRL